MKRYIKPELQILNVAAQSLICASMRIYDDETVDVQGSRRRGLIVVDDEDEWE